MQKILSKTILSIILVLLCVYLVLDLSYNIKLEGAYHPAPEIGKDYFISPSYDYAARNLSKYKECLQFFRNEKQLVTYDQIKFLGKFLGYSCCLTNGDYQGSYYCIKDPGGTAIDLWIYPDHNPQSSTTTSNRIYITEIPNRSDLRYCRSSLRGVLTIDNLEYTYRSGELFEIDWCVGSAKYNLWCNSTQDYGSLSGFTSRLLNADTAVSATKILHLAVQIGYIFRQTRFARIALQLLAAALMFVWGILQKKHMSRFCKKALLIEDEEIRKRYLKDCRTLKLLLAGVFTVMALVEYCEPVFYSLFLLLYAILLGLVWWQQRLINKEAFAEITDPAAQCASE